MAKRMTEYQLTWKRRNMKFLMLFSPVAVLVFTLLATRDQYEINLKAIQEGHSVGFQFGFIFPIVMGLSSWIVALVCKCQILEDRVTGLEERLGEATTPKAVKFRG